MTTFAELFASLKDEIGARYRSPIWGSLLISLSACHWKIIVFFLAEKPNAKDAIKFVEENTSIERILVAIGIALLYVTTFPWIEFLILRVASSGKRVRNDFHTEEREREIVRRKLIAQRQAETIEIELGNKVNQSKLADIELAKSYQSMLSGEHFGRWLNDLKNGAIHNNLNNSIVNYLNKVDSIEGKFIDSSIESAHANFVSDLSTLLTALNDGRQRPEEEKRIDLTAFSQKASEAQKEYRQKVREVLGI